MSEKVIGAPVPFVSAIAISIERPTSSDMVIGTYVYQPNPTTVPTAVYNAFVDGDMTHFKTMIEGVANITLLYARFSWNYTIIDENYLQVTDLVVGMVFKTKDAAHSPTDIQSAALAITWFSDMWYACNMQNGLLQAWLLQVIEGIPTEAWIAIGAIIITAVIAGSAFYFSGR